MKPVTKYYLLYLAACTGLLLCNTTLLGQQLNFDHINYKNGLINNAVKTIYQDKKGILYFGTNNGLSIYYGNGFKNIDTCNGKKIGAVNQITGTPDGTIFVITATIPFLYRLNGQSLQVHPAKAPSYLYHFEPQGDGSFLVGADDGLHRFDGKSYQRIPIQLPDSNRYISKIISCSDSLWLIGRLGSTMELVNRYTLQSVARYPRYTIQQLFKDSKGNIWIATKDIGVKILTANAIREKKFEFSEAPPSLRFLNQTEVSDIAADNNGVIYLATVGKGLVKYLPDGKSEVIETRKGLSSSNVKTTLVDREGNLWVGTNLGVDKLSNNILETFTESDGILSNICFDAALSNNGYLMAANKEGITVVNTANKQLRNYAFSPAEELYYFKIYAFGNNFYALNRTGIIQLNPPPAAQIVKTRIEFPERINAMAADGSGNIYIGGLGHIWYLQGGKPVAISDSARDIRTLIVDSNNILWVGTYDDGIIGFSITSNAGIPKLQKLFQFKTTYYRDHSRVLQLGNQGTLWYGTRFSGLYHLRYLPAKGIEVLKHLDAQTGISSDFVQSIREIESGKVLIGTADGLDYINITNSDYRVFASVNKRFNFSTKINQIQSTIDGQLWLASDDGVMHFQAQQLLEKPATSLFPVITNVKAANHPEFIKADSSQSFTYKQNTISFQFAAPSFINENLIRYSYSLLGSADTSWSEPAATGSVTFSELQPGAYTFRVRAIDINGLPSAEIATYTFQVKRPFYRTNLFIALVALLGGGLLYLIYRWRIRGIQEMSMARQKEQLVRSEQLQRQLEDERVMKYFSGSMIQKNSPDEILWDITKNVISRLGFEDCVIYLLDEKKGKLVQKAAWGPKTTDSNKIINPLEISIGRGIVGHVAESGLPEIVDDTTKDYRYIIDDDTRLSEIAVPIFAQNKVVGVIDSEHSDKGFYTQRHLQLLTTIATLCGHKLELAWAEELHRNQAMELLINQRKTAEARLESMRLQMNPHFLFNALNSIQQMILSGDERSATLYLSKFSKLLRTVLVQSSRDTVTLREEVETLKLYVELESLRFKNEFEYQFRVDENLEMDEIKIPTLLIQPFVENAIWHGLLNKKGMRLLRIYFEEDVQESLVCVIEDNGVGRAATQKDMESGEAIIFEHTGKGISTARERLEVYSKNHQAEAMLQIVDMKDENQKPLGTRVVITLPFTT